MTSRVGVSVGAVLLVIAGEACAQVAMPPVGGNLPVFAPATIAAGELLAREQGLLDLEAVAPSCVEATAVAMAEANAAERAKGAQVDIWGSSYPFEILQLWGETIRESCRFESANQLIAASREWSERPAAPWEAVWHAVLVPLGETSYWSLRRSPAPAPSCDGSSTYTRGSVSRNPSSEPRFNTRPAQSLCESIAALQSARRREDRPLNDKDRRALQVVAELDLDDKEADALSAFALDVGLRGGVIHRELVGELFCERLTSFETPEAMGRMLDRAQELRVAEEAELFEGISKVLDAQTMDRLFAYAIERQSTIREVHHEAWYAKLPPEAVSELATVRCQLGIPERETRRTPAAPRRNGRGPRGSR